MVSSSLELRFLIGGRCLAARGLPLLPGLHPARGRCAIAIHRGHGPRHWDLFLESGGRCLTVSIRRDQQGTVTASWLPPHRRRYLAFSGPVSGGRGNISIVWNGIACWRRMGRIFMVAADIPVRQVVVAVR